MDHRDRDEESPSSMGELPSGQMAYSPMAKHPGGEHADKPKRAPTNWSQVFAGVSALATAASVAVFANQCAIAARQITLSEQQQKILASEHRAWVFPMRITRVSDAKAVAADAPFSVRIENVGGAPVTDLSVFAWVRSREYDLPPVKVPDCSKDPLDIYGPAGRGILPPGGTLTILATADGFVSADDLKQIDALTLHPFVFGQIKYWDHLGTPHATFFCRRVEAVAGEWQMYGCPQRECAN